MRRLVPAPTALRALSTLTVEAACAVGREEPFMQEPSTAVAMTSAVSPGIRRALAHIERHFTESLYLGDLAALAGLSVCRFVTVFRRQVGLTPHRFICHRRIHYAKALLREGMPPALAASEAGFFDQSHLSRHFKSICGVTPGRYLRELDAPPRAPRAAAGYGEALQL